MREFKPGDLVRVKEGTHQEGMPDHRVAVIVEEVPEGRGNLLGIVRVLFLGQTRPLKFHVMFLEHFTTS